MKNSLKMKKIRLKSNNLTTYLNKKIALKPWTEIKYLCSKTMFNKQWNLTSEFNCCAINCPRMHF